MNWIACLEGGPFDGRRRPIPSRVDGPPARLNGYLCPCCGQLVVLAPGDPIEAELIGHGARCAPYRFFDIRGTHLAYQYVTEDDEAAEFNDFYGLTGDLAVTPRGRLR